MKDILVFEFAGAKTHAVPLRRSRSVDWPAAAGPYRNEQSPHRIIRVCVSATIYVPLNSHEDKRAAVKVLLEVDQEPLESTFKCRRVQR